MDPQEALEKAGYTVPSPIPPYEQAKLLKLRLVSNTQIYLDHQEHFDKVAREADIVILDDALHLYPIGNAYHILPYFPDVVWVRRSTTTNGTYNWETEFRGLVLRIHANEVFMPHDGTIVELPQ